jgi:hypothetical protein
LKYSLLLIAICYSQPTFLISDFTFTNKQDKNKVLQLLKKYDCKLSKDEQSFILYTAEKYRINPLVILAKIDSESSMITGKQNKYFERLKNRILGYGLYIYWTDSAGKRYCPYETFFNQVDRGIATLRHWYDDYRPGKKVKLSFGTNYNAGTITPENASTYSLYRYTPIWAGCYDTDTAQGKLWQGGNMLFLKRLEKITNDFNKCLVNL